MSSGVLFSHDTTALLLCVFVVVRFSSFTSHTLKFFSNIKLNLLSEIQTNVPKWTSFDINSHVFRKELVTLPMFYQTEQLFLFFIVLIIASPCIALICYLSGSSINFVTKLGFLFWSTYTVFIGLIAMIKTNKNHFYSIVLSSPIILAIFVYTFINFDKNYEDVDIKLAVFFSIFTVSLCSCLCFPFYQCSKNYAGLKSF